jgi:hypothetical protein
MVSGLERKGVSSRPVRCIVLGGHMMSGAPIQDDEVETDLAMGGSMPDGV